MSKLENIVPRDGYLVDSETGEKVVFYECDPDLNTECDHAMCRTDGTEGDGGIGFCSKTLNPAFRKEGGRSWYAVEKTPDEGEPYWGREYID
jgi:hypothetical protein